MAEKRQAGGEEPRRIIEAALAAGGSMLNEYESRKVAACYGAPTVRERFCADPVEAAAAAAELGWPVVLKLVSRDAAHKKERGFVAVGLSDAEALGAAARRMLENAADIRVDGFLVQELVRGERELLAGMKRDPVFGPAVTLGLGGIFAEALHDVSVRTAPLGAGDAAEMLGELGAAAVFGAWRGLEPVDAEALGRLLVGLGRLGLELEQVAEVDINPLIVDDQGRLAAVDALVILAGGEGS